MIKQPAKQRYRNTANQGIYEVSYVEPVRQPGGAPQLPDSNLVNLVRKSGRLDAPVFIVTTIHDFKQSFVEVRVIDLDDDTTAPSGEIE